MAKAVLVVRILLGLIFVVFGANSILHFLPMETPPGNAGQFMELMVLSHWATFVGCVELVGGILLLVGRFVPLGLVFLGPVIVNALLFHFLLLNGAGVAPALATAVLEVFLIWVYRRSFLGLFEASPELR